MKFMKFVTPLAVVVFAVAALPQAAQTTAPQSSLNVSETVGWITGFLEAHGCSATKLSWSDDWLRTCNTVTQAKGCIFKVQIIASVGKQPPIQTTYSIDLSDLDPARSAVEHQEAFDSEVLSLSSRDHKVTHTLQIDTETNGARLRNAVNHAIDLCSKQSPF